MNERQNVKQVVRSFAWEPTDGDELSGCPDCATWHARFEWDEDSQTLSLREWHEDDCPCWGPTHAP